MVDAFGNEIQRTGRRGKEMFWILGCLISSGFWRDKHALYSSPLGLSKPFLFFTLSPLPHEPQNYDHVRREDAGNSTTVWFRSM